MAFAEQTIDDFLDDVVASAVAPSGGAVAALGGAFGAALCELVCIHTTESDDADEAEFSAIRDELETRRTRFAKLAGEDSYCRTELSNILWR